MLAYPVARISRRAKLQDCFDDEPTGGVARDALTTGPPHGH